jgi:hypothetical protein
LLIRISFWKAFSGAGNDWPLALCDSRSIDRKNGGTIAADLVYHNRFTENERAYFDERHKWYWFPDMAHDEALVFRQVDTAIDEGGGVLHASFFNPHVHKDALPRESIELRAFVAFE